VGYSYDRHLTRLVIQSVAAGAIGALLPLFFLFEFSVQRKLLWSVVTILTVITALLLPNGQDAKQAYALTGGLLISTAIVLAAAARRQPGWVPALCGLLPCIVLMWWAPTRFGELWFFFGFSALSLAMLSVLVLRMREQQGRTRQALLRSAQLEVQLLKRTIEPHFLMNTLTSILEWVEVEPKRASRFIEALADEMRLLSRVAGETLIPLDLEIQLCRSHLAVMSLRHERVFDLRTTGNLAGDRVPPAILHTLLENALTHGTFTTCQVEFVFERTQKDGIRRYRLLSPEAISAAGQPREGTGFRYVRARLEESFPGAWSLVAGVRPEGWETVIEISEGERAAGVGV
jgi:Histidine kinase